MQVGQVIDRKLTSKGVTFTVAIEPQHRELVKGDSKFVVNSRVDVKVGLCTLFENGCLAVEQGLTTFEELIRVLGMPHGE